MKVWFALAKGVVLESLRRKDLWVVAILGFLMMISAGALGFFGFEGLQAFAKDLAATVLGLFSTVIAVITTARLMPDEIKNRTLYPLLARPIRRLDLLIGKLLGAIFVTWMSFLLLCIATGLALLVFRVQFEPIMAQYVLCKLLGLAVLCSLTFALSTIMTQAAAATVSFIFAFGSSMITRALVMAHESNPRGAGYGFKVLNGVLPQFGLFDLGGRAANMNWGPVPIWVIGSLFAYAIVYSSAMLFISWMKFNRQAI
ncbi:MAG: ABC transporter permease [Armatimonadetes bacterium]|nr:ABC transporter permease [Armatimonadota bacterium]